MVKDIRLFNIKMTEQEINLKTLADKVGLTPLTLSSKVKKEGHEFKLSEALCVAEALNLSDTEFKRIFLGKDLRSTQF